MCNGIIDIVTSSIEAIRKVLDGPQIFWKKLPKRINEIHSFQTYQQVTQWLQFQYQMHREAVQFAFVL